MSTSVSPNIEKRVVLPVTLTVETGTLGVFAFGVFSAVLYRSDAKYSRNSRCMKI